MLGVAIAVTSAFIIWLVGINSSRPDPDPVSHSLEGNWQQFIWDAQGDGWKSGGVYRVAVQDTTLTMSIVENWTSAKSMVRSTGLSNVTFDGQSWIFDSLLENGVTIRFELDKKDDATFEGHSYYQGSRHTPNRWLRLR